MSLITCEILYKLLPRRQQVRAYYKLSINKRPIIPSPEKTCRLINLDRTAWDIIAYCYHHKVVTWFTAAFINTILHIVMLGGYK